jgi:lipopolysaccharide/colanic/teichoic acid biosynthesis glycosyltransferase
MYPGKRIFDIIFSLIVLIMISPILLLVSILIKLDSNGAVFYRAKRVGQFGTVFKMWKFRTMVAQAETKGPSITVANDPRVTKIGKILRKTKIDEWPSFLNVLQGDMSIVGPRPESEDWIKKYSKQEEKVLLIKPGITGPSQLKYRNEERLLSGEDWQQKYLILMKDKLSIDLRYFAENSFFRDLKIIFRTII